MYVVRLPVEVIWQLCHLGAIEVFDVPHYLWTSCDGAILPVTAVRQGMKYFVPGIQVAPARQCFLLLPFTGPKMTLLELEADFINLLLAMYNIAI